MSADPRQRFNGLAQGYARWRPSYPPALLDWIEKTAGLKPGAAIVDIGCGTGIATRLWTARGHKVTGVDPNLDMLAQARVSGPETYVLAAAEATGLPSGAFDLLSAGQSFHWLDLAKAQVEASRILKPGGSCCAFWNLRADTPAMRDYEVLLRRHSAEYAGLRSGPDTIAAIKRGAHDAFFAEFPNLQKLGLEGFFGRVFSSSYAALSVADRPSFEGELEELFERHQKQGTIDFAYRTAAILWRPRP